MSEVEQRIAAMNRERAGHLWSAAVRLQREVLELRDEMEGLRELNAKLEEENRKLVARVKELEGYIRGLRIIGS
jgi:hypothetical protein